MIPNKSLGAQLFGLKSKKIDLQLKIEKLKAEKKTHQKKIDEINQKISELEKKIHAL